MTIVKERVGLSGLVITGLYTRQLCVVFLKTGSRPLLLAENYVPKFPHYTFMALNSNKLLVETVLLSFGLMNNLSSK